MNDVIYFYSARDKYGEFSNFYRRSVIIDGRSWPTTEHYFQAQKFLDVKLQEQIRKCSSPGEAAREGRDRKKPLRKDWEAVCYQVMLTALRAKFTQHEDLKNLLISTGNTKLVEHTSRDSKWGDGGDGSGQNLLGKALMEIRNELK